MNRAIYRYLVSAGNPAAPVDDVHFFAACISHRAGLRTGSLCASLGLTPDSLNSLLYRFFPVFAAGMNGSECNKSRLHGLAGQDFICECRGGLQEQENPRLEEWQDLNSLLLLHRTDPADETSILMSAIIANACLDEGHLWQDLGLADREDLNSALQRHFSQLHLKNSADMKWKKFFYRQLCDQAEIRLCQAPSCNLCNEYANCFGPDGGESWDRLAALR